MNNSCKPPKCLYSETKKDCVKPNPYTVFISHCTNLGKSFNQCKTKYYQDTDKIKAKVCDYLKLKQNIKNYKTCPKNRQPKNGICHDDYNIIRKNKNNIECCYKDRRTKTLNKVKNIKKSKINKFIKPENIAKDLLKSKKFLLKTNITPIEENKSKSKVKQVKEPKEVKVKQVKEPKEVKELKEPKVKEPKVKEPKVKEVKEPKVKEVKVKEPKVKEPKVKEPKVKESKVKEPKKPKEPEKPKNPFYRSRESPKNYLNKATNKYFKVINKYQHKIKPKY